jgi:hypothetical protein
MLILDYLKLTDKIMEFTLNIKKRKMKTISLLVEFLKTVKKNAEVKLLKISQAHKLISNKEICLFNLNFLLGNLFGFYWKLLLKF